MIDEFAKSNLTASKKDVDSYSRGSINARRDLIKPIPAFEIAGLYLNRKE